MLVVSHNPNTFAGLVGTGAKKTISGRRKEGRVEKKSTPARPGARTRHLPRARSRVPCKHARGACPRQASLSVPIIRVGRLRRHHVLRVLEISFM